MTGVQTCALPISYAEHCFALGVPAPADWGHDRSYPIEANFDLLSGIDFSKGCFVGQEVVSRMQNRAHVRKRVVPALGEAPLASGTDIVAGATVIGRVGSAAGKHALALVRLDRAAEAKARGEPLLAGGVAIVLRKPDWATFDLAPAAVAVGTP